MRLDSQRVEVERILSTLSAPLAEHASLLHAQDERRKAVASATRLSAPLVHLRDLLDALSFEPNDGVVLQQLRQRIGETELLATSRGDLASADWLKRLSAIRGVKGADVDDLHRATPHGGASAIAGAMNATSAMEFAARLRWDGPPASHNDHTPRSTAPAPHKSEQSGGAK
ncbi:Tfp pilus assembly protein PilN [Paraburkholderia sp. GAS199]|uniref:fimbrial assembly protein n=1 Tax=Paraburkholderia sp. GAS199 TaxID=3035126 RepID=UPI003D1A40A3